MARQWRWTGKPTSRPRNPFGRAKERRTYLYGFPSDPFSTIEAERAVAKIGDPDVAESAGAVAHRCREPFATGQLPLLNGRNRSRADAANPRNPFTGTANAASHR